MSSDSVSDNFQFRLSWHCPVLISSDTFSFLTLLVFCRFPVLTFSDTFQFGLKLDSDTFQFHKFFCAPRVRGIGGLGEGNSSVVH